MLRLTLGLRSGVGPRCQPIYQDAFPSRLLHGLTKNRPVGGFASIRGHSSLKDGSAGLTAHFFALVRPVGD
jgi:hypothetical protein